MVWNFKNLEVWKVSFGLIRKVYDLTGRFPGDEIYGLTSQLRRAVVSVSSNIAEGCGRRTSKDFAQFLYNALGSTKEVESQLLVAVELGYLEKEEIEDLVRELGRVGMMLLGLIEHISNKDVR